MTDTILAIDPGSVESAYLLLDCPRLTPIGFGKVDNSELLKRIGIIKLTYSPVFVIEMIQSFGMAVGAEVFMTAFWAGQFCKEWNGAYEFIYRGEEKIALCHSARAKDPNIRAALIDLWGGQEKAIGNKKCPICKGKGKHRTKWRCIEDCCRCKGTGYLVPPGPLCSISNDVWSALAVAVTYGLKQDLFTSSAGVLEVLDRSFRLTGHDSSATTLPEKPTGPDTSP